MFDSRQQPTMAAIPPVKHLLVRPVPRGKESEIRSGIQTDPTVASTPKGQSKQDPDGEWPSLGYANWLIDQRFSSGTRRRGYIQHFVKSFSAPLMAELADMWGPEFTEGAAVRFRGAGHGSAPSIAFVAANFSVVLSAAKDLIAASYECTLELRR